MKFSLLVSLALAMAFLVGCVHLPNSSDLYSGVPANVTHSVNPLRPTGPASPATLSPAKRAIQTTFNWLATLSILGGIACLALGGFAFYRGLIVSGVKFVLAGILLPVSGIFVAYHWLLIVSLVLASLAVYLLWHDWKYIGPGLSTIEGAAVTISDKAMPAAKPAASAPASVAAPK